MSTEKATTPMYVFGKPKVWACHDCITWPQDTHGLRSQDVRCVGSAVRRARSTMMMMVAVSATSEVIRSSAAVPAGRAYQVSRASSAGMSSAGERRTSSVGGVAGMDTILGACPGRM